MKTTHAVKTKADARNVPVDTNLEIDWEGMTQDDLIALASQTLVIKLQSSWRKNGIPAGDHAVKATDHKVGARAPRSAPDIFALAAKMSPEDRAVLIAKLTA